MNDYEWWFLWMILGNFVVGEIFLCTYLSNMLYGVAFIINAVNNTDVLII